jgi:signal transduction histidine kinase
VGTVARVRRPPTIDLLLAAALIAWAVLEALLLDGSGSHAERVAWGVAMSVPVALRRQFPLPVAIGLAAVVILRVLSAGGEAEEGAMPFPSLLLATFSASAHVRSVPLAALGGVATYAALVLAVGTGFYSGDQQPSDIAILSFFVLAAWGAGHFVRRRAAGEARLAVMAERARISRELHDIIGHSMSVISLQAGAAEQLLDRDPARARTHLQAVLGTTSDALAEMRRLMGVLEEEDAGYAPQPGLAKLPELAAQAGFPVELRQEGERPALSPGLDLTAYRVVQEALTNARKHGGAERAGVHVRYAADAVEVEIRNPLGAWAQGESGGRGLAGMHERVRLYGGELEAGADGDEFRVRARLPL